jgi:hypothetical protein
MNDLPAGFVLDAPPAASQSAGLPPGFVLDNQSAVQAKTQPRGLSDADVGIPAQPAWASAPPVQQPAWMSGAPVQQQLPPDQQMGMLRGTAHEAVSGVPIIGPAALKGLSLANSYINNDTYAEEEQKRQAEESDFEQRHPIVSTAANIGGGVASLLPLGATGLGARLLGLTGGLPGMIGRGALSGAAIGTADAAVRGQDPTTGAAYGGAGGAAGPVLGRAVSTVAAPVGNAIRSIRDPSGEAARRVASYTRLRHPSRSGRPHGRSSQRQSRGGRYRHGWRGHSRPRPQRGQHLPGRARNP